MPLQNVFVILEVYLLVFCSVNSEKFLVLEHIVKLYSSGFDKKKIFLFTTNPNVGTI